METCMRGFSFMPTNKLEVADLQYIEGGELERAWRSTRRERLKQREQKIWDEFVKENDVIKSTCIDDPYQFLDPLPEPCFQEIMEKELQNMSRQSTETIVMKERTEPKQQGNGDNSDRRDNQHVCVVTFADEAEKDDYDVFQFFDDEPDEEDAGRRSPSPTPLTVRENRGPNELSASQGSTQIRISQTVVSENVSPERGSSSSAEKSSKSSENVTNVIESSIYCAKVKDLRMKINEEMLSMVTSMDRRDIITVEAEDIGRLVKRSAEFSSRFNRIYMYQLQRQMHEIKRNNNVNLPFAKHTQFQSQMVRIVSLHQNILQALQVFHKSLEQTYGVRESGASLLALVAGVRAATALCTSAPAPKDFEAAADLYKDDLHVTCDKFEQFVEEYIKACQDIIKRYENMSHSPSKRNKDGKNKSKKRTWHKNAKSPLEADAKLSMYSLDNVRLNLNVKSSSSREIHASKIRSGRTGAGATKKSQQSDQKTNEEQPKSPRKSPKCRRPLMRDPQAGRPRPPRPRRTPRDPDVPTMVEAVDDVSLVGPLESEVVEVVSPAQSRGTRTTHGVLHGGAHTRRHRAPHTPHTPRSAGNLHPHHRVLPINNRRPYPISPHSTRMEKTKASPRSLKLPSARPLSPHDLRLTLSSIKSEQESLSAVMNPVSKIQCAIKRDLDMEGTSRQEGSPPHSSPVSPASRNREYFMKRDRNKTCEVTRLLKQLCSGDAVGRADRVSGAKNAQLLQCISNVSPRQPSTPQLLRILEETIQKKVPKPLFQKPSRPSPEKFHLQFNVPERTSENLFQYRTKFVQHMLTSALYANSAVGKPWEMIGSVSEQIIDELLLTCIKEMELHYVIQQMYEYETR